jgi:hypothetical protein
VTKTRPGWHFEDFRPAPQPGWCSYSRCPEHPLHGTGSRKAVLVTCLAGGHGWGPCWAQTDRDLEHQTMIACDNARGTQGGPKMTGQPCRATSCTVHPAHGTEVPEEGKAPECQWFRLEIETDNSDVDADGSYDGCVTGYCRDFDECEGCDACDPPTEAELAERAGQQRLPLEAETCD